MPRAAGNAPGPRPDFAAQSFIFSSPVQLNSDVTGLDAPPEQRRDPPGPSRRERLSSRTNLTPGPSLRSVEFRMKK
jgi:hypothetical protein